MKFMAIIANGISVAAAKLAVEDCGGKVESELPKLGQIHFEGSQDVAEAVASTSMFTAVVPERTFQVETPGKVDQEVDEWPEAGSNESFVPPN